MYLLSRSVKKVYSLQCTVNSKLLIHLTDHCTLIIVYCLPVSIRRATV